MPLTAPTITPTVIIPPYEETVVKPVRLRVGAEVQRFGYALELLTSANLRVKALMAAAVRVPTSASLTVRARVFVRNLADIIDVPSITYTQSSVFASNTAATNAGMTDGSFNTGSQTGTNGAANEFVRMDFGAIKAIATVYVGCDFDNVLPGGWNKTYAENCAVEVSNDASTWTSLFNTGTFSAGIKTFSVSTSGRYIRIKADPAKQYLAVTEFYATSD